MNRDVGTGLCERLHDPATDPPTAPGAGHQGDPAVQ